MYTCKLKITGSQIFQNLVNCWKNRLKNAPGKGEARLDSFLRQSIWLCQVAMKDNKPAILTNPTLAKKLEQKGYATFQDIWSSQNQEWSINEMRWNALKGNEKRLLLHVLSNIKVLWPTSPMFSTEPSMKHWEYQIKPIVGNKQTPWLQKLTAAWKRDGCFNTPHFYRKKLNEIWKATGSGRLELLLWRVLCRKLPVRAVTSKWGQNNPHCRRCHTSKETLKGSANVSSHCGRNATAC